MESLFQDLKRYVGFTDADASRLRSVAPLAERSFVPIIDRFYDTILTHEGTRRVITGGDAQVARLKGTLVEWARGVFRGPYDEEYYAIRARIGLRHVEVGLEPHFMIAAMSLIREGLKRNLRAAWPGGDGPPPELYESIDRILALELAIALHAYDSHYADRLRRQERLATIGQIAASISHELKNPVGVIKMSVHALRRTLDAISDEKARAHFEKIDRNAGRVSTIVNGLLDFARLRAPERVRVKDLSAFLREAVSQVQMPEKVTFETEHASALPELSFDVPQIAQVVSNLIRNAVEAMPDGGILRVRTRSVEGGRAVAVDVEDTGAGIPEESLRKIFEPLFTTKTLGTGLGLPTSRNIVEAHGGRIEVQSRPGSGSRFSMILPADDPGAGGGA